MFKELIDYLETNLKKHEIKHSPSMLICSEVVPASGLVLVNVPALNQFKFGSAVQDDIENVEAG
ncbi:hypothetical protein J6590_040065 [Homalodisca vitripennis]|nr:hypothetical protein J6590_040065 [Homalodisca vitripennis]